MHDVWFIRHGESTWNAAGLWQGQADPPLSERGRAQAAALAEQLAAAGIAALVASDLARARETAEIVGARLGLVPQLDPGLRELDVGCWSGLTPAEVGARWPEQLALFRAGDLAMHAGGGESRLALRERAERALRAHAERARGPLAVVSHLGLLRVLSPGAQLAPGERVRLGPLAPLEPAGHTHEASGSPL